MTADVTGPAIEMYLHHGQLGLKRTDLSHCSVVQDNANPDVWSSNKVFAITARSAEEIRYLIEEVDQVFDQLTYRHFIVDPQTPDKFRAYLAQNDYLEYATFIQMILTGALKLTKSRSPIEIWPVRTGSDWTLLSDLVKRDHAEGARTQSNLDESVTRGIVEGYRAKSDHCQFFLARSDSPMPCAYGSSTNCSNGMGMVEDLFTLPDFRKQGIASALINHCVNYCRERGAKNILIGSHADQPPKHLYQKLGFEPSFLTSNLMKQR